MLLAYRYLEIVLEINYKCEFSRNVQILRNKKVEDKHITFLFMYQPITIGPILIPYSPDVL